MKRAIYIAALSLSACGYTGFEFCWIECDETGGDAEDGELYCGPPLADGTWRCLDAPQHDSRVKAAIESGAFVPFTDAGSCPNRGREWDTLREVDTVVSPVSPLRAVECSDTPITQAPGGFSLCFPEIAAWAPEWPDGAVALPGNDQWASNCAAIGSYAFLYDYAYGVPCALGVTCLGFDDRCTCKCESESDCGTVQTFLETYYLGEDEYGLIPGGWESTCTGVPWEWDQWAYGDGGYVGTACEWNGENPGTGNVPQPLEILVADLDCLPATGGLGASCSIPEHALDHVLASPGLIAGSSSASLVRGAVQIDECNHLCSALGLQSGDVIESIGFGRGSPLDPAAWLAAHDELLQSGTTQAAVSRGSQIGFVTIAIETET